MRAIGLSIDPANAATLDLLDHAASLYNAVATGEQSGDHTLLGTQGVPLWLNYFHNDNVTYAVNNWVGAVLAADRLSGHAVEQAGAVEPEDVGRREDRRSWGALAFPRVGRIRNPGSDSV